MKGIENSKIFNSDYVQNLGNLSIKWQGLFYRQCSEIFGANHRFIPIFYLLTHTVLKSLLFSGKLL